ncbi:MAG: C_GCAxxG_C_C family protein [Candidatus Cloacimonetes bacterium]|nr:C_GCAxxG_C_C family protein [Candidatus Cloacimonadota bacterium]
MLRVLNEAYNERKILEEKSSAILAGGIMQHGYQCGMIWGAVLAAGVRAYELYGPGPEAETRAVMTAQKLVKEFQSCSGEINCVEITDIDNSSSALKMLFVFLIKGKTLSCMRLTGKYSSKAFNTINESLYEKDIEIQSAPVSCASELARKMGASEKHIVMAAGLAGGIGLCGGGCGALGTAIWLMTMDKGLDTKMEFKDPRAMEMIEKAFLPNSDYEFECSDIVGRKFENIDDHAKFIQDGGCAKLIDALAGE